MTEEKIIQMMIDLINNIKNVAPEIWAIAVKQIYVYAFQNIAMTCFSIIAIILLRKCIYYLIDKHKENTDIAMESFLEAGIGASGFIIVLNILIALFSFTSGISHLINPEYYAIKLLIGLAGIE